MRSHLNARHESIVDHYLLPEGYPHNQDQRALSRARACQPRVSVAVWDNLLTVYEMDRQRQRWHWRRSQTSPSGEEFGSRAGRRVLSLTAAVDSSIQPSPAASFIRLSPDFRGSCEPVPGQSRVSACLFDVEAKPSAAALRCQNHGKSRPLPSILGMQGLQHAGRHCALDTLRDSGREFHRQSVENNSCGGGPAPRSQYQSASGESNCRVGFGCGDGAVYHFLAWSPFRPIKVMEQLLGTSCERRPCWYAAYTAGTTFLAAGSCSR